MKKNVKAIKIWGKLSFRPSIFTFLRTFLIFITIGLGSVYANSSYSQVQLDIHVEKVSLEELFNEIQKKSEYIFFYKDGVLDGKEEVTIKFSKATLMTILDEALKGKSLGYKIEDRQVIIFETRKLKNPELGHAPLPNQEFIVKGTVLDQGGFPLPGATVVEKETSNGTATDLNGNFSLAVSNKDVVLLVSFVGYVTKEIPVAGQTNLTVTLEEDAAALEEVVVVGYGTQKKSDLTGAVSSLKVEDLNPGANVSVDQLMMGRSAGVQITQASSAPGGGLAIRVRGASSLNAGNEPLYVIDGLPIDNSPNLSAGGAAEVGTNSSPRNPLNALNPNDIESIEILKDASATAIYGSRGANGVILVTTKKGRSGEVRVTYDGYGGVQNVAKRIGLLSTSQYIDAINDLSVAQGNDIVFTEQDIARIGNGTDWQEEVYRPAYIFNNNISLSGGTEKTTLYTSFNYFNQEGVVENSGIERYVGRINVNTSIGERAKFGINFNTSLVKDNNNVDGIQTNENAGPIYSSLLYDPTEPIFSGNGTYNQSPNLTVNNPVSLIEGITSVNETNRTFGNLFLNYEITSDLSAKLNFGTDRQTSRRDIYNSSVTFRGGPVGGIANISSLERSNYLLEYTMNYNKTINENHTLTVLGGITYQKFNTRLFTGNISGFPTDAIATNNLGLGNTNADELSSGREENTLLSYLGRVNYSLLNKFLFTGSIRADGSSRFGSNNKFGYFPSFAFGWKLAEEEFIPQVFSDLKLRTSWGQTGNQEIGNYASQLTFGIGPDVVFNNTVLGSMVPLRIANPDLKWETTEQFNIGLDAAILRGRISGSVDYFIKNTKDLLFNLPLPRASGYSSVLTNLGEIQNKGFEFLLNSTNVITDNFKWQASLNFSTVQNKVLDLGRIENIVTGDIQSVGNTAIITVGEPLASYYGYVVTGIFQEGDDIANSAQPSAQPGFPIFEDRNGDGKITPDDQTIIGNPFPDFTYGIQNSFSYKSWTLDLFIQGQQGADLLNINLIESLYPANFRRNRMAEQIVDRWTPDNPDARWPSSVNPNAYGAGKVNTLTMQDASYIRLKNVQLSYMVPVDNIDFLASVRVYLAGQNLFTLTDYVGFDPEANSFGRSNVRVDYSSYPLARTFLLGFSASFK